MRTNNKQEHSAIELTNKLTAYTLVYSLTAFAVVCTAIAIVQTLS